MEKFGVQTNPKKETSRDGSAKVERQIVTGMQADMIGRHHATQLKKHEKSHRRVSTCNNNRVVLTVL